MTRVDHRRLMNECPSVIGMMTSVLQSDGSVDSAIRDVAKEGPPLSRKLFDDVVKKTDTKGSASLSECLGKTVSELPKGASGYARSVMMVLSASESSDDETRDRMLSDASDIAIDAVKEMGESYGASLTAPCMAVFGIGIMIPMILMSIIPMLNVGGMFGSKTIDQNIVIMTTLVAIPCCILMVALYVRSRNPFLGGNTSGHRSITFAPLLISIPLALVFVHMGGDVEWTFLFSMLPACLFTALLMVNSVREEAERRKKESSLMDVIFDIGNRMLSGINFERATVDAIANHKVCSVLSEGLEREYALSRGDPSSALSHSLGHISGEVTMALKNIHICSEKDGYDAGRMAVNIGKQMQNRNITMKNLEIKLKSTTDMMVGTAMLFAPMVLGLSISMLGPLSRLGSKVSMEGSTAILAFFLIELSALISILVSSLGSGEDVRKIVWRFCIMCPVSLLVFALCCSINL